MGRFASDTLHLTAGGETTWHGFAQAIVDAVRRRDDSALKVRRIEPMNTDDYPTPARRPLNSRLATARLTQNFRLEMPSWSRALEICMDEIA